MSGDSGTLMPAITRAPGISPRVTLELSVQAFGRVSTSIDLVICVHSFQADLRDLSFTLLTKLEQVAIDEISMCGGETVRQARIVDF
jgi:hypothetical protein